MALGDTCFGASMDTDKNKHGLANFLQYKSVRNIVRDIGDTIKKSLTVRKTESRKVR